MSLLIEVFCIEKLKAILSLVQNGSWSKIRGVISKMNARNQTPIFYEK